MELPILSSLVFTAYTLTLFVVLVPDTLLMLLFRMLAKRYPQSIQWKALVYLQKHESESLWLKLFVKASIFASILLIPYPSYSATPVGYFLGNFHLAPLFAVGQTIKLLLPMMTGNLVVTFISKFIDYRKLRKKLQDLIDAERYFKPEIKPAAVVGITPGKNQ